MRRNSRFNSRTEARFRNDCKFSPDEAESFAHTDQAEPWPYALPIRSETNSVVRNLEMNFAQRLNKFDLHLGGVTVFGNISQRFLNNSK
jgi:hypothetical protein